MSAISVRTVMFLKAARRYRTHVTMATAIAMHWKNHEHILKSTSLERYANTALCAMLLRVRSMTGKAPKS